MPRPSSRPSEKPAAARPQFNHQPVNHQPARSRNRKPGQGSKVRRDVRSGASRSNGTARRDRLALRAPGAAKNGHSKSNGSQAAKTSSNGNSFHANSNGHVTRPRINGHAQRAASSPGHWSANGRRETRITVVFPPANPRLVPPRGQPPGALQLHAKMFVPRNALSRAAIVSRLWQRPPRRARARAMDLPLRLGRDRRIADELGSRPTAFS